VTAATPKAINVADLFASIDAMDTERFLCFIAEDGTFRFGSAPAVTGRDAIRGAVDGFFATLAGLRHVLHRVIDDGTALACEGEVTYTRHDGRQVTLPFANVFGLENGLISEYAIYIDIAPLYQE